MYTAAQQKRLLIICEPNHVSETVLRKITVNKTPHCRLFLTESGYVRLPECDRTKINLFCNQTRVCVYNHGRFTAAAA